MVDATLWKLLCSWVRRVSCNILRLLEWKWGTHWCHLFWNTAPYACYKLCSSGCLTDTEEISEQPKSRIDWERSEKLTYRNLFQPCISYNLRLRNNTNVPFRTAIQVWENKKKQQFYIHWHQPEHMLGQYSEEIPSQCICWRPQPKTDYWTKGTSVDSVKLLRFYYLSLYVISPSTTAGGSNSVKSNRVI